MQSHDGFFKQMRNPLGFRQISVVQGREGRPTNSPQVRIEKKEIGFVLVLFALLFEFGRPQDFLPPLKVIPFPSVIDASIALAVLFSGRVSLTNLQSKLWMGLLAFMACWVPFANNNFHAFSQLKDLTLYFFFYLGILTFVNTTGKMQKLILVWLGVHGLLAVNGMLIVQAASGYEVAFAGYQDHGDRPANTAIFIADVLGALFAYSGILAALNHRHATGRGQHVDTTLMESMLSLMPYEVQEAQFPALKRRPVYPPFKTTDGYLMIAAVSPRNFEALLDAIGVPGWRDDPTMATDRGRQQHWSAVMARVEAWTSQRTRAECERVIGGAGVPVTAYQSVREALAGEQLKHRGTLVPVRDAAGEYRVPNLPFRLSDATVEVGGHVPALGEHSAQVLAELAGLSGDALAAVVAKGRPPTA